MAKVNGIQIKGLKYFVTHDGMDAAQGNIYLDNKKLGFWTQDADCGEDYCDFDESILNDRLEAYQEGFDTDHKHFEFAFEGLESLLYNLTNLLDHEKLFKKYTKKGFKSVVIVTDGYNTSILATYDDNKKAIETKYDKAIEDMKKNMFPNKKKNVCIYTSPGDFNITVDKTHPAPPLFITDDDDC